MPRDARAYLADIIDACHAINRGVANLDLEAYRANRLVRSSVEREFTIIGEAMLEPRQPLTVSRGASVGAGGRLRGLLAGAELACLTGALGRC